MVLAEWERHVRTCSQRWWGQPGWLQLLGQPCRCCPWPGLQVPWGASSCGPGAGTPVREQKCISRMARTWDEGHETVLHAGSIEMQEACIVKCSGQVMTALSQHRCTEDLALG